MSQGWEMNYVRQGSQTSRCYERLRDMLPRCGVAVNSDGQAHFRLDLLGRAILFRNKALLCIVVQK